MLLQRRFKERCGTEDPGVVPGGIEVGNDKKGFAEERVIAV